MIWSFKLVKRLASINVFTKKNLHLWKILIPPTTKEVVPQSYPQIIKKLYKVADLWTFKVNNQRKSLQLQKSQRNTFNKQKHQVPGSVYDFT